MMLLTQLWLVKVIETKCVSAEKTRDGYGYVIPPGIECLKGHFFEGSTTTKSSNIFKISKKVTHFYKETVNFPFVNIKEGKKRSGA